MAQISLGEVRWRMVRRVLRKQKFQFADARNMNRNDSSHFEWLVREGFFEDAGEGFYRVTPKGKTSAELGMYEV